MFYPKRSHVWGMLLILAAKTWLNQQRCLDKITGHQTLLLED